MLHPLLNTFCKITHTKRLFTGNNFIIILDPIFVMSVAIINKAVRIKVKRVINTSCTYNVRD